MKEKTTKLFIYIWVGLAAFVVGAAIVLGINKMLDDAALSDAIKQFDTTEQTETHGVTFLFEKDGVRVYRFYDRYEYHYFTTLGETMSTVGSKYKTQENIR